MTDSRANKQETVTDKEEVVFCALQSIKKVKRLRKRKKGCNHPDPLGTARVCRQVCIWDDGRGESLEGTLARVPFVSRCQTSESHKRKVLWAAKAQCKVGYYTA